MWCMEPATFPRCGARRPRSSIDARAQAAPLQIPSPHNTARPGRRLIRSPNPREYRPCSMRKCSSRTAVRSRSCVRAAPSGWAPSPSTRGRQLSLHRSRRTSRTARPAGGRGTVKATSNPRAEDVAGARLDAIHRGKILAKTRTWRGPAPRRTLRRPTPELSKLATRRGKGLAAGRACHRPGTGTG